MSLKEAMALKDRVFRPIVANLSSKAFVFRYITRLVTGDDLLFLNVGYEEDPPMALPLATSDERDRFFIQLYHSTATQEDLSGKRVLEVGCGHGGGASYLVRTLHPASYTGLDLNPAAIAFCRKRHNLAGLEFVQGDAENLPFPDQSFDAVINIESAIYYPRFPRFLAEVARVLRPGGYFLYTDGRTRARIADWDAALANAQMRMLSQREINAEVVRGIERNSQRWLDLIDRHWLLSALTFRPPLRRGQVVHCPGVQGSKSYRDLQSGAFSYRMYCFTKA